MKYDNRFKSTVAQSLFEIMMKDVGYKVVPLGIEEIVREITSLPREKYINLNLSKTLRCLPDFLVASDTLDQSFLVELKYREKWSEDTRDELFHTVKRQVDLWTPLYLVVFLGESATKSGKPSGHLGAIKLESKDGKIGYMKPIYKDSNALEPSGYEFRSSEEITWASFTRIQDVFPLLNNGFEDNTITKAVELIKSVKPALTEKS